MAKGKSIEISVKSVFEGKQDSQQAFVELILMKKHNSSGQKNIDSEALETYNQSKVFSDVRVV